MSNNIFYVNNAEFQDCLVKYFDTGDRASYERIGHIFMTITKRILHKSCFVNYSYDIKQDMISNSIYYMIKYIKIYDPSRGNPFAYFSQICFNGFKDILNRYKKRNQLLVSIDYLDSVGMSEIGE